jgi:FtsH-binding integral membrane protein
VFNQHPNDPRPYDPATGGVRPNFLASMVGAPARPVTAAREGFLTESFVWMFLALLVSAATAWMTLANEGALQAVVNAFPLLLIGELGLVMVLSIAINRLSSTVALAMLFVYAALNGTTFAFIALAYTTASVTGAFVGAAAIFGAAAFYGVATGRDLTSLGGLLFAGLIGIVVASIANIFVGGDSLSFVIGIVGVVIFTGLTAFDVQRIKYGGLSWIQSRENASVIGALRLYLDFVNLFLMLLRVTGSRR